MKMANNRMWLQIKGQIEKILLAKYYPSTGWYIFHTEKELNEWFKKNFNEPSMFGRTDLELMFQETDDEKSDVGMILEALDDALLSNQTNNSTD